MTIIWKALPKETSHVEIYFEVIFIKTLSPNIIQTNKTEKSLLMMSLGTNINKQTNKYK